MSKTQAPGPQKPNMISNLITIAIIFVVFQLFMSQTRQPQDTRTVEQIYAAMKDENAKLLDVTIAKEFGAYKNKINTLPPDKRGRRELDGAILVADTQLKAGIVRDDLRRLNLAYSTLDPYENKHRDKPEWNQVVVPVADETKDTNLGWNQWTGQALYDRTVQVLDQHNRTTLVWGFFPGYQLLNFLVNLTGANPSFSYAFAALLLAVAVRAVVYPLTQKQMMYSRQMQQLQPLIKELQEKHKGNPTELQAATMGLYKEYGLNPMAGCLPMALQMPLIFLIYQCMLHYRFEFQKGVFLWISPAGHAALPNLVAANLGQKDYILLTLYGVSMIATSFLTPVSDPSQMRQQRVMGVSMSALFAVMMFFYPSLPSAFVLYWTCTNILTTVQSLLVYRMPLEPLVKVNTKDGGVYPTDPPNGKGSMNGKSNGKPGPSNGFSGPPKKGTPAKHKPKKRK